MCQVKCASSPKEPKAMIKAHFEVKEKATMPPEEVKESAVVLKGGIQGEEDKEDNQDDG